VPGRHVQFAAGSYYHIYNRGANRNTIFVGDSDYWDFFHRLRINAVRYDATMIAYCLMPNHFHLLVRQESDKSAGLMVQCTCNGYAQAFNRRRQHSGTLFQGRFQSLLVANDEYIRHLCRYIHTNPVKDGFALQPELWPYSDYVTWISQHTDGEVARSFILEFFGSRDRYRSFVAGWAERKRMPGPLRDYLTELETAE
jgi:REP element-mobilizing transposase RayT